MILSNNRNLLLLSFLVVTIFTVSVTESLQSADGFSSKSTAGWVYELNPGESQVLTWTLVNTEEVPINIEFYSENKGSELIIFEKEIKLEPKEKKSIEFIVVIPDTHPNNVEYRVDLYALEKGESPKGSAAAILINYKMVAHPIIKVGDNPVFTPEPILIVEEDPEPIVTEIPSIEDFSTPVIEETIDEIIKRIQESNEKTEIPQTSPIDSSVVEKIVTSTPETYYLPEPIVENKTIVKSEPIAVPVEECNFIEVVFSWFGFNKC